MEITWRGVAKVRPDFAQWVVQKYGPRRDGAVTEEEYNQYRDEYEHVFPGHVMTDCVFCAIVAGDAPARREFEWPDALAFEPLNPVTPGHLLVVPKRHVVHAAENPGVTAATFARAAEIAIPPCNLITSVGAEATQSVFHLHVHVVPRRDGDGLPLPWTPQQADK